MSPLQTPLIAGFDFFYTIKTKVKNLRFNRYKPPELHY